MNTDPNEDYGINHNFLSDPIPLQVTRPPHRRLMYPLTLFIWAMILSLVVSSYGHAFWFPWVFGVLSGSTGAGVIFAAVDW
jgi:hypothetical protein